MSVDLALIKVLENGLADSNHFLSTFPTQLLLRTIMVKGTAAGALGKIEYLGYSLPNALKTQPVWCIKKYIYDATGFQTDSIFADGELKFDKVFDSGASEYASYTYTTS